MHVVWLFLFAYFTAVKFKGKFVFRNCELLNDSDCVAENILHFSRTFRDDDVFVALFVCLFGVIRSSKEEKNFVLLYPACLNVTFL